MTSIVQRNYKKRTKAILSSDKELRAGVLQDKVRLDGVHSTNRTCSSGYVWLCSIAGKIQYPITNGGKTILNKSKNKYAKYGYIFSIPFVLAFLVFSLYPLVYTVVISFTDLQGIRTRDFEFVTPIFQNYVSLASNASFRISLFNTAVIWIINFIPQIILALALAAWFTNNRLKIKAVGFFKVVFYMPNIITAASIAILFQAFFGAPVGPLNDILMRTGIFLYENIGTSLFFPTEPVHFFRSAMVARGTVSFIQFWMWYGVTMIILIAGIMGISPTLFEAAAIDGATNTQTFFRVTLPSLRPIVLYVLVTSLIGGLQMFDIPRLLVDRSGPDNATLTTAVFINNQAFLGAYRFNMAAAASMVLFCIIAVFSGILFFTMRDKDAIRIKKERKAADKLRKEEVAL